MMNFQLTASCEHRLLVPYCAISCGSQTLYWTVALSRDLSELLPSSSQAAESPSRLRRNTSPLCFLNCTAMKMSWILKGSIGDCHVPARMVQAHAWHQGHRMHWWVMMPDTRLHSWPLGCGPQVSAAWAVLRYAPGYYSVPLAAVSALLAAA